MDVKGAKALSERLAEASRNVDLPPSKAVNSVDSFRDRRSHPVGPQARAGRRCRDAPIEPLPPP
jgi:hypothetical protein